MRKKGQMSLSNYYLIKIKNCKEFCIMYMFQQAPTSSKSNGVENSLVLSLIISVRAKETSPNLEKTMAA